MDAQANFAYSTVAIAPSPATTGTSMELAAGGGALFPAAPFNVVVWPLAALPLASNAEIVRVTAIVGDVLTITRQQEGTSARTIGAGDQIAAAVTKKTLDDLLTADAAVLAAAEAYADGLVVGLLDDRGNFDASGNSWPTTGGSGSGGAILKGDLWTVSVAGALGGHAVTAGDVIRALVDTPGSTDANWAITENNFGYVALADTAAAVATRLHAAPAKTTLVDGDEVSGTDSANGFSLIRTVWNDVWTYIKSKADAVYAAIGAITGAGLTMSTAKLLGRSTASTGAVEEIAIGTGLTLSAGTLSASGGGVTIGTTAITSGTSTRLLYDNAGVVGEAAGITTDGNLLTLARKLTITQGTANEGVLASTGGSNTGSNATSALDFSWTLNTSGSPDVIAYRITDTARGASTRFLNIYGGASGTTSIFSIDRLGNVVTGVGNPTSYALFNSKISTNFNGDLVFGDLSNKDFVLDHNNNKIACKSTGVFGWSSSSSDVTAASVDTGMSRISAGLIGAGTGGAASFSADVKLRGVLFGTTLTVATLPTASTVAGGVFRVVDLTALTNGSTPTGGGSNDGLVKSNGTAYVTLG